jgi:hypothetical protein
MTIQRLLGVTVMPEYLQSESVNAVLDRLQAIGVNAITTSPYVMEPTDEATGGREPALDAAAGECPVYTLAHGYGPEDDFQRRFEVAWHASPHGVWLNRYGYLSNAKLKIVGNVANNQR